MYYFRGRNTVVGQRIDIPRDCASQFQVRGLFCFHQSKLVAFYMLRNFTRSTESEEATCLLTSAKFVHSIEKNDLDPGNTPMPKSDGSRLTCPGNTSI
ncbi:hypothetical protein HOLleu_31558 [Holothuria leucospilota]|uniref:Uncharacterized protein n=1 Tax=Holothuria leucospilota TaxID=206669 RepID=A0A9Q1BIE9_HOLLE|nr:hypothetical protein HOLleu_31558 [Holothuria leucospilota]